ncbi:MAG: glycosyltransferase [Succinivibrio sp.]|nr:glycosyltransferase [Succinivibrio sp.]
MRLENKRPIRVAHIIGKLTAGGVESVVYNYYKNIDHSRFQFDFFYDKDSPFTPSKKLVELGANFYPIPSYKNIFSYIGSLVRQFKKNKYLIVHSNMNTLSPFSLYATKLSGFPVRIIHNHSTAGKGEFEKNCLKYALKPFAKCFATKYCACGNYAGKWFFGKTTFDSGKITVFKNSIDLTKFNLIKT